MRGECDRVWGIASEGTEGLCVGRTKGWALAAGDGARMENGTLRMENEGRGRKCRVLNPDLIGQAREGGIRIKSKSKSEIRRKNGRFRAGECNTCNEMKRF